MKNFVFEVPYNCGQMGIAERMICISFLPNTGDKILNIYQLTITIGGQVLGYLDPEKKSTEAVDLNDFLHNKFNEYSNIIKGG